MRGGTWSRRVASAAAIALVAAGFVGSTPAQALPPGSTIDITCRPGYGDPVVITRAVVLRPGEVLQVVTSGCTYTGYGGLRGTYQYVDGAGDPVTVGPGQAAVYPIQVGSTSTYTAPDETFASTFQFSVSYYAGSGYYGDVVQVSIAVCTDGVCPTSSGTPMWVQSFQRADAAESCPAGWSRSWEQWPSDGAGGFVCTRSIPAFGAE